MSTMKTWEYRVETIGSFFRNTSDDAVEEMLDEWGQEGWEVFAFHPIPGSNKATIIAKRAQVSSQRKMEKSGFQW